MLALTHPCRRDPDAEPGYLFGGNQSGAGIWSGSWYSDRDSVVQVEPGRLRRTNPSIRGAVVGPD